MVSRTVLLWRLLLPKYVSWALEQPASSLMEQRPRVLEIKQMAVNQVDSFAGWFQTFAYMGSYGHKTPKPSKFYCNEEWIQKLGKSSYKRKRVDDADRLATAVGGRVNGNKNNLKLSQAYPKAFGKAVQGAFERRTATWKLEQDEDSATTGSEDEWTDVGLQPLISELGLRRRA